MSRHAEHDDAVHLFEKWYKGNAAAKRAVVSSISEYEGMAQSGLSVRIAMCMIAMGEDYANRNIPKFIDMLERYDPEWD